MNNIIDKQEIYFNKGITRNINFRICMLENLKSSIIFYDEEIYAALKKDLNKNPNEAYLTEIQIVLSEISQGIKRIKKWNKDKKIVTPLAHFPAKSKYINDPYGRVLIIAPWNYPFQLAMLPLIGAIMGGNCVVLKPSRKSSATMEIIKKILDKAFFDEYIYCVDEKISHDEILKFKYDMIFFTGSAKVGKIILKKASKDLTPTVLELGGKSPCIVEKSANLDVAARRIAWGKFLNAGQTCVAPDYILIDESIKEDFIKKLQMYIEAMYDDALTNENYTHIIDDNAFDRLMKIISSEDDTLGGRNSKENLCIEPTILPNVSWESESMHEEIFGPVLPVITYANLDKTIEELKLKSSPLALYIFSNNNDIINMVLRSLRFGGGCVNDVIMHVANHKLPFGGAGTSGMGLYHGRYSFETFTRKKSIEVGKRIFDNGLRYPPYSEGKQKVIEFLKTFKVL